MDNSLLSWAARHQRQC